MAPDALDARDPDRLELRPEQRGAQERAVERLLVRRLVRGRAQEDRVVAVVERFDLHERLGPRVARVVAGPLAERTLDNPLFRVDPAFNDDLGLGRGWDSCGRTPHAATRVAGH